MIEKTNILVADDHTIVRMGITALLETEPDICVVGEAEDGQSAIRQATAKKPDVILMDLMMPIVDGAAATAEICKNLPNVRVLILTTPTSSDEIQRALDNGASGAISKNTPYAELIDAIRRVARGEEVLSEEIARLFRSDPPVTRLSPRQTEILQLIVKGMSNPDIARILGISTYTVKEQVNLLFGKLNATNRAEAITIALRKRLVSA